MFKVHVDISLFTNDRAFGMISGKLTLPVVPQVGDLVAFRPTEPIEASLGLLPFGGNLRVTDRIIGADADLGILLALEDVTAASPQDAQRLVTMFQQGYGLMADVWEP